MNDIIRIGTRESQLAVWQATQVKQLLERQHVKSELVFIKSEGDVDLSTPLYELGVQGIFTKTLDAALLNGHIDIAVHSMKDVPTQLAKGIIQAAVLPRGSYKDLLVLKDGATFPDKTDAIIATSSIRRMTQWLHRFPGHKIENLRGNVNTRLRKLHESEWDGAIFAAAGLERINLRPANAIELDWMLPAPAQGAVIVVCREDDTNVYNICRAFNDEETALCTKIERDFLRALMGGCSVPISGLARKQGDEIIFEGSIVSLDGKHKADVQKSMLVSNAANLGKISAKELIVAGGAKILEEIRNEGK